MFGNRTQINVFWPKRDEVTGNCRRLLFEELYDLYPLFNMTINIKSIRTCGAWNTGGGEKESIQGFD